MPTAERMPLAAARMSDRLDFRGGFLERAREFRRRYQGPEGLPWIKRVNHPLGAVLAMPLTPTQVSPNMVTLAGLLVHLVGALIVGFLAPPTHWLVVLLVIALWQLAFSLDCADGQLARARGQTSAFGAWLDQMSDGIAHGAVYGSLILYTVRALDLDALAATLLASVAIPLTLMQTFTTWQRAAVIGGGRPVGERPSPMLLLLYGFRSLLDYGAFLFIASLLLLWPVGLLVFLLVMSAVNALYVIAQVGLAWRLHLRGDRQ